MDLQHLKWTKNVRREDGDWAYKGFKVFDLFKLAWKDDEKNADKSAKNDLILLRQKGYVTHLVKVLDYKSEHEDEKRDYDIYRIVEVLWAINFSCPPTLAKADALFNYPEVLKYQSGNIMELENLPTFKKSWEEKSGLEGFQIHIEELLALSNG
jgi:hypothetical protein